MQKLVTILILTTVVFTCFALPVLAKDESTTLVNPLGGTKDKPAGTTSVDGLVATIIKAFLSFLGAFATLMFIYGGFTMILSGGSPEKVKKGQTTILWAVIGIVVVLSSYGVMEYVFTALTSTT